MWILTLTKSDLCGSRPESLTRHWCSWAVTEFWGWNVGFFTRSCLQSDSYVCFWDSLIFLTNNTLIFLSDNISSLSPDIGRNLNCSYFLEIKSPVKVSNIWLYQWKELWSSEVERSVYSISQLKTWNDLLTNNHYYNHYFVYKQLFSNGIGELRNSSYFCNMWLFFIIAVVYIIRNMFRLCRDCRRRKQSTRSCTILLNSLVKYVSRMKLTNHFLKNALKGAYRIKKSALLYRFSSFLQEFRSMPPIQKTCLCLAIKTNAL